MFVNQEEKGVTHNFKSDSPLVLETLILSGILFIAKLLGDINRIKCSKEEEIRVEKMKFKCTSNLSVKNSSLR